MKGRIPPALALRRRVVNEFDKRESADIAAKVKKLEAQLDELDNSSNVRVPPRPALNNDADDSEALAARVAWVQAAALAGEKAFPDESSAENKKWTKVRTEGEELAMDQMMVEERVEEMNVGGVVMEEQELQALADLKGWDIEIRSLICIKTSSDFGSLLKRTYRPVKPLAPGQTRETLYLLQEMRAKRTSHFQHIVTKKKADSGGGISIN